jgi:hypothetical protein
MRIFELWSTLSFLGQDFQCVFQFGVNLQIFHILHALLVLTVIYCRYKYMTEDTNLLSHRKYKFQCFITYFWLCFLNITHIKKFSIKLWISLKSTFYIIYQKLSFLQWTVFYQGEIYKIRFEFHVKWGLYSPDKDQNYIFFDKFWYRRTILNSAEIYWVVTETNRC